MGAPTKPYQPYAKEHETPKGPGDQRPTALQIVKDCNAEGNLKGKLILITGASSGIGVETARALYETGAQLVLSARDMARLAKVITDIKEKATIKDAPEPETLEMHLDSLESVRKAAADFNSRFDRLDILICNAGVMACPQTKTQDGLEMQVGTNHFAHFLFFQLLKPTILSTAAKTGHVRVINVSSSGHRRSGVLFDDIHFTKEGSYQKWVAYGQSKTANVYMANAIDRRYGGKGVRGLSLHPGGILTDLPRHLSQEELKMFEGMDDYFKNAEQGAATQVWAALSPHFDQNGGVFLGDLGETGRYEEGKSSMFSGDYVDHTYDEASEDKLWKVSCETVGVSADD